MNPPAHENSGANEFDDVIGRRIGKYEIVRKLGAGGMGAVFEARDEVLKRQVAIKLIGTRDRRAVQRFVAEAQAAAQLNHPHVVTIHDVGQSDGQPFLAMELVDGKSAAETLRLNGPLPWKVATRIAIAACRGLEAAHKAGLIHRDLKPGNILLGKTGEIKLADFGLAKWTGNPEVSLTAPGTIMGTPEYMSPEQCSSDVVTPQADLYSLGACYFALLTGRPPFVCDVPVQTMYAHCNLTAPDPRDIVSDVPESVIPILQTAMAKLAYERFADAAQMRRALEQLLKRPDPDANAATIRDVSAARVAGESATTVDRVSTQSRRGKRSARTVSFPETEPGVRRRGKTSKPDSRVSGILIGAVVTFAAIAIGVLISGWSSDPDETDATASAGNGRDQSGDVITEPSVVGPAEVSTQDAPPKVTSLLSLAKPDGHSIPLSDPNEGLALTSLAMSRDGRYLAARTFGERQGRLIVWDVQSEIPLLDRKAAMYGNGGDVPATSAIDQLAACLIDFSPDGEWLVTGQLETPLRDVEAWRLPPRQSDQPRPLKCPGTVNGLSFSPVDGRLLVSVDVQDATADESLFEYENWPANADGVDLEPVWRERAHRTSVRSLDQSADGRLLAVTNGAMLRIYSDRRAGNAQQQRMENQVSVLAFSPVRGSSWLVAGGAGFAEIIDAVTMQHVRVLSSDADGVPAYVGAATFSPDGRWLLVGGGSRTDSWGELRLYSTADWSLRGRLSSEGSMICSTVLSPQRPVAVTGSTKGELQLWDLSPLTGNAWSEDSNARTP